MAPIDAILILSLGVAMILIGLQSYFDPARRSSSVEILKATTLMLGGVFLIYFFYASVRNTQPVVQNVRLY